MSNIKRVVRNDLTRVEGVASLASFNILSLITSETPLVALADKAKRHTSSGLAGIATDWGTSSEVYKAASKVFSQNRTINEIYIIQRDAAVAKAVTITWDADFASGETIVLNVNGDSLSIGWDSDQATTQGLVNAAIAAAFGVASSAGTAQVNTVTATADYPLEITASASGGNAPAAVISVSAAGNSIADDLAEAVAETSTYLWYAVYNCQALAGQHMLAAAYIQSLGDKAYFGQSSDADVLTSATDDVISRLDDAGYTRAAIVARDTLTDHAFAGLLGYCLSADPGFISFANKGVVGATPSTYTDAQIGFIEGKNGNTYDTVANNGLWKDGVMVDGVAIEVTRDLDYLVSKMNEAFLAFARNNDKIPFTIQGLAQAEGVGQGVLDLLTTNPVTGLGVLDRGDGESISAPVFTVPALASISAADKTARTLTGCTVRGTHAGSIIEFEIDLTINLT